MLSFYDSFSHVIQKLIITSLIIINYFCVLFLISTLSFKHLTFIVHRFLFNITLHFKIVRLSDETHRNFNKVCL